MRTKLILLSCGLVFLAGLLTKVAVKQRATFKLAQECMAVSAAQDKIIKHWLDRDVKKRVKAKKLM